MIKSAAKILSGAACFIGGCVVHYEYATPTDWTPGTSLLMMAGVLLFSGLLGKD